MAPIVRIESSSAPATAEYDSAKIVVNRLLVNGASIYSAAELVALTGFQPQSELTLADLRGMASKIAERYRSNGYFVAQAYLPAQEISDGVVTIAVVEGRYGKIVVRNQSNLSDDLIYSQLEGINTGDAIAIAPLENRVLLPKFSEQFPGQLQLAGFVDTGSVTINKNPWDARDNYRTLSGAGIGLNWSAAGSFVVRTSYARKLASGPAISAPDKSGRFWIQAVKYF